MVPGKEHCIVEIWNNIVLYRMNVFCLMSFFFNLYVVFLMNGHSLNHYIDHLRCSGPDVLSCNILGWEEETNVTGTCTD